MSEKSPLRENVLAAIDFERDTVLAEVQRDFAELKNLVTRAYDERLAGNISESRVLLNEAMQQEFELTFDVSLLAALAQDWGVPFERGIISTIRKHPFEEN